MTGPYDRIHVASDFSWDRNSPMLLNRRTRAYYFQAIDVFHTIGGTGGIKLMQGSYHPGYGPSGGTHDGGGAGDTEPEIATAKNWELWEKAQRMCMFASFDRPYLAGEWDHHNHAGLLGDKEASGALISQYNDYHVGRDGLKDHSFEPATKYRPPVIFNPIYPIRNVDLSNMIEEANRSKGWTVHSGVKRIQSALNVKMNAGLHVDGLFGTRTKTMYARWERGIGGNGDGVPGRFSLVLLGAGRFNVKP